MTPMVPGEIIIRKNGHDDFFAVGEELVEITGDRVAILTDMAIAPKGSTKQRSKKRVDVPKPDCAKRFLPKKWLPSMPV